MTPSLPEAPRPAALERIRAAARAELARAPRFDWRRDALRLFAITALLSVVVVTVAHFAGGWAVHAGDRALTLTLLLSVQALGALAAFAPRARPLQLVTLSLAALGMVALVLLRGEGAPSASHGITCTLSHVALAIGPLVAGVALLRHAAFAPSRALAAGSAIGTVGAFAGELVCGQGARHVALFHVPAWLVAVGLALFVSRRLRPLSFAP